MAIECAACSLTHIALMVSYVHVKVNSDLSLTKSSTFQNQQPPWIVLGTL